MEFFYGAKRQTIVHLALHRKLKIDLHEPHENPGLTGDPENWDTSLMALFQNWVRWPCIASKIAVMASDLLKIGNKKSNNWSIKKSKWFPIEGLGKLSRKSHGKNFEQRGFKEVKLKLLW